MLALTGVLLLALAFRPAPISPPRPLRLVDAIRQLPADHVRLGFEEVHAMRDLERGLTPLLSVDFDDGKLGDFEAVSLLSCFPGLNFGKEAGVKDADLSQPRAAGGSLSFDRPSG